MALRKNYSTELKNVEALKQIAAELGLVQTRGPHRGEGSIRRLLEAIADGDVYVTPAREDNIAEERIDEILEEMAKEGLIELGNPNYTFRNHKPVEIDGPPLSEQIIADRR